MVAVTITTTLAVLFVIFVFLSGTALMKEFIGLHDVLLFLDTLFALFYFNPTFVAFDQYSDKILRLL
jgi:hypothetical protein